MRLVYFPDPVLMRPTALVTTLDDDMRERAEAMIPYMGLEGGIGLAAPQIGWAVRLLIADPAQEGVRPKVFINPEIVWRGGGTEWDEEGCLSFPGIFGDVLRARRVKIKALDLAGNEVFEEASDLYARVLQHEIDHLEGVLFVSKMAPADKTLNKSRLVEMQRRFAEGEPASPDVQK